MATRKQRKIDKLKQQLKSGSPSQAEAEGIRQQILGLGGKVNLTNFGYVKSGTGPDR